jgi:hypothetical protein
MSNSVRRAGTGRSVGCAVLAIIVAGCSTAPRDLDVKAHSSAGDESVAAGGSAEADQSAPSRNEPAPAAEATASSAAIEREWTLAVYLASETIDDDRGAFSVNALERHYAELAPFMNIVVLADGEFENEVTGWNSTTRLMQIRADDTERVVSEITPPAESAIAQLSKAGDNELMLSTPQVLRAFLDFAQSRYPSRYFALEVLDHGEAWNGAVYDFADEPEPFTMLGPMPLAEYSSVFSSLARPIDVLAFDACLMQNETVNTWWSISGSNVKYTVGSEQDNNGWNTDKLVRQLGGTWRARGTLSPPALATAFVGQTNESPYDGNRTESVVDLANWSEVVRDLDALGAALMAEGGMTNPLVREVVNERIARPYGALKGERMTHEDLVDAIDLCEVLAQTFGVNSGLGAAAATLGFAVQSTLLANQADIATSHGLSIHLPMSDTPPALGREAFEKNNGPVLQLLPNWVAFLHTI